MDKTAADTASVTPERVSATLLDPPEPLNCDHWFSDRIKCADVAVVRLEFRGLDACSCARHRAAVRRALRADALRR